METALKALDALESDIFQVKAELERTEAALEVAYDAPKADFDEIDRLNLRKNSVTTRLERDSTRLLAAQYDVQQKLFTLVNDLNTVYQITRNSLITMPTDEIATLLHLSARTLQRANIGAVAIFHQKVVDVSKLTPDLHPMALQRLEDIEGVRKMVVGAAPGHGRVPVGMPTCARRLAPSCWQQQKTFCLRVSQPLTVGGPLGQEVASAA